MPSTDCIKSEIQTLLIFGRFLSKLGTCLGLTERRHVFGVSENGFCEQRMESRITKISMIDFTFQRGQYDHPHLRQSECSDPRDRAKKQGVSKIPRCKGSKAGQKGRRLLLRISWKAKVGGGVGGTLTQQGILTEPSHGSPMPQRNACFSSNSYLKIQRTGKVLSLEVIMSCI